MTCAVPLAAVACATAPAPAPDATPRVAAAPELNRLVADLEHDLARARSRSPEPVSPQAAAGQSQVVRAVSRTLLFGSLAMPVHNLRPRDISDSWGAPRDGGERKHRGIDLFAPRGTQIVAVADGVIEFIGNYPKGGRCLWLSTEQGVLFYYAHLERWAAGIYEGMQVRKG
ncbi:MAG TPA: M23 family metallopeptidase, partial [Thermoanaerobaculia bacterium]